MILKLWSSDSIKIRLLQTELNRLFPNNPPKLRADGIFGQKTRSRVIKLQQLNRELVVNGVFDPETQAELKRRLPDTKLGDANTTTAVTKSSQVKYQNEIKQVFDKEGTKQDWDLFTKAIQDGSIPQIKKILFELQNAPNAIKFAQVFITFRKLGLGPKEMGVVIGQISKLKGADLANTLKVFSNANGSIATALKSTKSILARAGLIVTLVECFIFAKQGNYAAILGEIYKFAMGKVFKWAAIVDGIQSYLETTYPRTFESSVVFAVLKAANPIGLGAVAVESIAASATAAYYVIKARGDLGAAIPRLDKLVTRMRKSPASIFVELGDNAGSGAYQLSRMSSTEWTLIMSYKWREFKNLF